MQSTSDLNGLTLCRTLSADDFKWLFVFSASYCVSSKSPFDTIWQCTTKVFPIFCITISLHKLFDAVSKYVVWTFLSFEKNHMPCHRGQECTQKCFLKPKLNIKKGILCPTARLGFLYQCDYSLHENRYITVHL